MFKNSQYALAYQLILNMIISTNFEYLLSNVPVTYYYVLSDFL